MRWLPVTRTGGTSDGSEEGAAAITSSGSGARAHVRMGNAPDTSCSCSNAVGQGSYFFCKNTSGSMPACLRMARSVPSGMSPGWLGMVVNRLVAG